MKIFILLPILVSFQLSFAQPYFLWEDQQSYSNLGSPTNVNGSTVWSGFDLFTIPIGFDFEFMDQTFTTFDFEATGRIIFDAAHFYFADLFTVSGLEDKGSATSLSPILYELSGSPGTQIFKLEVRNATFSADPTSTIDFQIWLYEEFSRLELHMGPNSISAPASVFTPSNGPFSAIHHLSSFGPLTYVYGLIGYGSETAPADSTVTGTGFSSIGMTLNACPPEGTIHIYGDSSSVAGMKETENYIFRFYPNPVEGTATVSGLKIGSNVRILDLHGRIVRSFQIVAPLQDVTLEDLPEGLYSFEVETEGRFILKKFIKL
jgi:hypothetical protein